MFIILIPIIIISLVKTITERNECKERLISTQFADGLRYITDPVTK
jgi:hypothetical protein